MAAGARARGLVLAVLVVAALHALGVEAWRAVRICAFDSEPTRFVDRWRVGSPDWRTLAELAAWVDSIVPAGEVVAFRAEPHEPVLAWAFAYLLPRHEVIPDAPGALEQAAWAVVFKGAWHRPDLRLVLEHPDGVLYARTVSETAKSAWHPPPAPNMPGTSRTSTSRTVGTSANVPGTSRVARP